MKQRYPELVILGTRFTPTDATYDAATGELSMSVINNTFTNGGQIKPVTATYNAATGVMELQDYDHGVTEWSKN